MPAGERVRLVQACKQTHAARSVLRAVANTVIFSSQRTAREWKSSRESIRESIRESPERKPSFSNVYSCAYTRARGLTGVQNQTFVPTVRVGAEQKKGWVYKQNRNYWITLDCVRCSRDARLPSTLSGLKVILILNAL